MDRVPHKDNYPIMCTRIDLVRGVHNATRRLNATSEQTLEQSKLRLLCVWCVRVFIEYYLGAR